MSIEKSVQIEQLASKVMNMIHDNDNETTTTILDKDPTELFENLIQMQTELQTAWKEAKEEIEKEEQQNESSANDATIDANFRAFYVEMMTDAFAEPLEEMRKQQQQQEAANDDVVDVNILAECLQSGMDLLTKEERKFFMEELLQNNNNNNNDEPYHTIRRRELGYDVKIIPDSS
eukprot:scaffold3448_cov92-Cylindrotheca_fusiformis.AAC.4